MLSLSRILCPVDFSEFSVKALDYAYSLASHYQAKLFVQHVTEPALILYRSYISQHFIDEIYARRMADARERIRELMDKYPAKRVEAGAVVQLGLVADSILAFAEANEVDLIAMGTHGRRGLDRVMVGATTEGVLRKARCAVLTIHEPARDFVSPASPDEPVRLQRILCCTDFSENSPRALEFALSLASEYNAELTLLHVLEEGGGAEQERHAMTLLEEVVPRDARTGVKPIPLVLTGEPYRRIIEHAVQAQTDLIVMGVRGRNIIDLAVFGSTTQRVIQLGPCPVLTVRT